MVNTLLKTTFRRLEQLERRHSAWVAATDTSGAKENLLASLRGMSERLRADPNWESMPKPTVEEVTATVREAMSRYQSEAAE